MNLPSCHFKVRRTYRLEHEQFAYMAWAAFQPLSTDSPHSEPQESVWFEFGRTKTEALHRLKAIPALGGREWVQDF